MAKVVPVANAKAFLDALEKSGLLPAGDVAALRLAHGEESDPKLLARDLARDSKLTRWQAGQLLHGFHQLMVGKYKLMDQLGTGEMGRVYLGEHAQLSRKVSLKILSRKFTANPEILKKILADGRQAAALNHRNLSHVFDVNSEDERYYLVTEFVEGNDLRKLVESSGATSPSQAADFVRQAAEGLEHAHSQGVVHGDLKPSNLIVDASGVVKILDLGLARLAETSPAAGGDESTEVVTLAAQSFHAPERINKQEITPLADVFSLGGILFYLLAGKSPLGNVKQPQDVKNACPVAGDELAELCARMLSEDPAARPQSARQVIEGLDAVTRAKSKPEVKEDKKSSNGDKPSAKQKKPLVAKSLDIPFTMQGASKIEEVSDGEVSLADASQPAATSDPATAELAGSGEKAADDSFAGFSLQTRRKKLKPAPDGAPPTAADASSIPASFGRKPSMAIVLAAGIGGGVLILALGITALFWALSRGKTIDKSAIAKAENKQAPSTTPAAEENPAAIPEANPEENPKLEQPASPAKTPEKTTPTATKEEPKTTVPPIPNTGATDPVKPPMPMPAATTPAPMPKPEPVKTVPEPVKPASEPAKPTPEPTKTVPEPAKPAPPVPAVPAVNPFEGFAKVATLPTLEEKGKAVADATQPFLLGTIKLPPKALCIMNLKGGDNAISTNAKQKFMMEGGNNDTSDRDWDIKLVTEGGTAPVIVAKLAIQNDQLNFQWTDEATKQLTSAPYLCNCLLTMSAGSGTHQLALRQPLTGEPMKVDLGKAMSVKYTIDYPPSPKQIVIQLGPPEGKFTKFKFEKAELTAKNDTTVFMTGPADDVMLLHLRLDCAMSTKLLTISAKPGYQIFGMTQPKPWVKTVMAQIGPATAQANANAASKLANLPNLKLAAEEQAAATTQLNKEVADTTRQKAEAVMLTDLVKALQGDGKIHFRILYEADAETRIALLSTGAPPPMAPAP